MINENTYVKISLEKLKNNLNLIRSKNIPVWRINKSGQYVVIPLERLEQFLGTNEQSEIVFFITEEWEALIIVNTKIDSIIEERQYQ